MKLNQLIPYLRIVSAIYLKRIFSFIPYFKSKSVNRFIILGRARTGSTLLHTYLNSHPQLLSLDELLHPENNEVKLSAGAEKELNTQIESKANFPVKAIGFKFFYNWAEYDLLKPLFESFKADSKIRIIHLKRKNHLRTLVSLEIAKKNKEWSKSKNPAESKAKQVQLTKEVCIEAFTKMENEESSFDQFFKNHPVLELFYENLAKNPDLELARVQTFLGVKPIKLYSILERQNPEPLSKLISNFSELKAEFTGTKWSSYFDI